MTIRTKLLLTLVAFAAVPAIAFGIWTYLEARNALLDVRMAQLNSIIDLKRDKIETFFAERKSDLLTAMDFGIIQARLPIIIRHQEDPSNPDLAAAIDDLDRRMKPYQEQYGYHGIMLTDAQGTVVYMTNESHKAVYLGKPLEEHRLFEQARDGLAWSEVKRHGSQGEDIVMLAAAPIRDSAKTFIGELVFWIDLGLARDVIQNTIGLGETGEVVIARRDGNEALFLFPTRTVPDAAFKTRIKLGGINGAPIQRAVQGQNGSGIAVDYRGTEVLAAWRYLPALNWGLVVRIDASEAFAPITGLRKLMVLLGLLILGVGSLAAVAASRSITRGLSKANERFRQTLEQMLEGCMIIGFDWTYLYVNETAAQHGHQRRQYLLGQSMLKMYPGIEGTEIFATYRRCMEQRQHQRIESEYKFADGSIGWYEFSIEPVPEGIFVLSLDISERKRAEEVLRQSYDDMEARVRDRTADLEHANQRLQKEIADRRQAEEELARLVRELENVNRELNDFAHIVSHDLKAPLRAISTLIGMLAKDYREKFEAEGREQVDLLVNRVQRMYALIEGILQYSRIGRVKEEREDVDLNDVVSQVVDLISPPPSIEVVMDNKLPTVNCDKTRLQQVFQNLVGNAVKFMDKEHGEIRIGSAENGGEVKFYVADNGPGIEEKHFEKVFKIFQTLRPRDEVESTGIGLAIVKKIVEAYEGKIWLESKIGMGTTFFFTIRNGEKNS